MYESISKNNELENEMTLDVSYFWYSDVVPSSCLLLLAVVLLLGCSCSHFLVSNLY